MGTRGAMGFYRDGQYKVVYNHFDSYPDRLGNDVLDYIHSKSIDDMNKAFDRIELFDPESKPTKEQIEKCAAYTDLSVSRQSTDDWYCVLRGAQGNLDAYAEVGLMPDDAAFMGNGLFCEYAYIINLDDEVLEVYDGRDDPKKKYPLNDCPEKFSAETTPEFYGYE